MTKYLSDPDIGDIEWMRETAINRLCREADPEGPAFRFGGSAKLEDDYYVGRLLELCLATRAAAYAHVKDDNFLASIDEELYKSWSSVSGYNMTPSGKQLERPTQEKMTQTLDAVVNDKREAISQAEASQKRTGAHASKIPGPRTGGAPHSPCTSADVGR